MIRIFIVASVILLFFTSCKKKETIFATTPYELKIPSHFPTMIVPSDNPMTVEGVKLGRHLFYEKKLSGDNTMSCATCHAPKNAFSDSDQFSKGITGEVGRRNSMALINLGWNQFFFWDGRAKTLEEQILEPVEDPIEMHDKWQNVIAELGADSKYRDLFQKAFNCESPTKENTAKAIAQFLRTMISGSSKFDVIYKNEYNLTMTTQDKVLFEQVTQQELAGYDLFKSLNGADCFHCHNGPLMQVQKFSNNGLDATFTDLGRAEVTNNPTDNGKFKVPTLRNVEFSAPYMHDGRFSTLDEVINHYSSGIQMSPTIDPMMEFANQGGVQLDAEGRALVKAFLLTLSDQNFINNPEFQAP